ncbi:MAG: hypothetical protein QG604_196 [Candidatus Dependentiae bacterium]|nr:hypothetical protein [Candidatus Dependentiae bacterium]
MLRNKIFILFAMIFVSGLVGGRCLAMDNALADNEAAAVVRFAQAVAAQRAAVERAGAAVVGLRAAEERARLAREEEARRRSYADAKQRASGG